MGSKSDSDDRDRSSTRPKPVGHELGVLAEPSWDPAEESLALARLERGLFPKRSASRPRLERYTLLRRVGAGAGGSVHAAFDPQLGREVAIKILRARPQPDQANVEGNLIREARALARLAHPHVVSVFDVGRYDSAPGRSSRDGGGVFIVMELVEGTTFRTWLEQPRTWREICELVIQAARGVAAAHQAGLVHRDLKPSNLLVGKDGRLRVADFGIAHVTEPRHMNPLENEGLQADVSATARGARAATDASSVSHDTSSNSGIAGTPRYMSPEQHRGARVDARADQYALCVTAFEALVGRPPFEGTNFAELSAAKHEGQVVVPADCKVPRRVLAVIERGLAVRPEHRHASMDDLAAALVRCLRRPRRTVIATALTGTLGLGLLATWPSTTDSSCEGSARVEDVYGADERAAVARSLMATGVPLAPTASRGIDERLSHLASRWVDTYEIACAGVHDDARTSRLSCLDGRLFEIEAVVAILREADADTVTHAAEIVDGLADPNHCLAPERLRARDAAGVLARARARVLRRRWAEFEVARLTGRYREVERELLSSLEAVRALDDGRFLVEALLSTGEVLAEVGRHEEAEAHLLEAYWLGVEIGETDVAARAAVRLVEVVGGARPDEGLTWVRHAEALVERHHDVVFVARLWTTVASVLEVADRLHEAHDVIERALSLLEQAPAEAQRTRVPRALTVRGNVSMKRGAFADAESDYAHAHGLFEQDLGPDHPDTAKALSNLARALVERGHLDAAREHQIEAVRRLEQGLGADHDAVAIGLVALAQIDGADKTDAEAPKRALAAMERAGRIVAKHHELAHPLRAAVEAECIRVLFGHRVDDAFTRLDRLLAAIEGEHGPLDPDLVQGLLMRAEARALTGDAKSAQGDRERARRICTDHATPPCAAFSSQ
jgi:eukaryotic-like serine/threonine-protein kinase